MAMDQMAAGDFIALRVMNCPFDGARPQVLVQSPGNDPSYAVVCPTPLCLRSSGITTPRYFKDYREVIKSWNLDVKKIEGEKAKEIRE